MDKAALRREVLSRRAALPDRAERSDAIQHHAAALSEFARAGVVGAYVGVGAEVETRTLLDLVLGRGDILCVPWRDGEDLYLARILSFDELVPVSFGLLEPPDALARERIIEAGTVDLMLIPGVAFDRKGGRLGHGKGFYDRLLGRAGPRPLRAALAFECQVVEEVPMTAGDERMDLVVTENDVLRVSARTASGAR
jgi:5-formyltetrahydrofolate cyclo-ligase